MATNGVSLRKGHTLLANLVASGEVPLALTVYGYKPEQLKGRGASIEWFLIPPAIVALLAGDLGVGSRLPMGYDTYNVPFAYRDRYYDSADNWYRYNDGYIYQVDPQTRLISAVIDAIV